MIVIVKMSSMDGNRVLLARDNCTYFILHYFVYFVQYFVHTLYSNMYYLSLFELPIFHPKFGLRSVIHFLKERSIPSSK